MKNKLYNLFLIFSIIITGAFTASSIFVMNSNLPITTKTLILSSIFLMLISNFALFAFSAFMIRKKREIIKKSFDSYVEKSISYAGVGMIMFDDNLDIIWISKFIEERLDKKIIGKKLNYISPLFNDHFKEGEKIFRFEMSGIIFQAQTDFKNQLIVLKDVTNEDMVMKQYISEKLVVWEMEIDNFQQFQTVLAEEDLFKVQSHIIKLLDSLAYKHNLTFRQYVNGKFLIYSNQQVLETFIKQKFDFLDKIRSIEVIDGINLSASIGVGYGSSQIKELTDLSKEALVQALARGGDQVAVIENNRKPSYFGSKVEAVKSSSRVRIKQIAKTLEEKLKSKDINKVIIYGHIHADLDAVGAALGAAYLASKYNKRVYIQNNTFDDTTQKVIGEYLDKEYKDLFIKANKANVISTEKDTMVIIVDTAEMHRIENEKALSKVSFDNVFIFDHHRVSELPKEISTTNTYIDTSASSASEIVVEILQFVSIFVKPPKQIAQMLLNGIYLDTKQFIKSTSSRTFSAASWLEKFGATSEISADILKLPEEHSSLVSSILSNVKEVKKGYFLSSYPGDVPQDIISLAADEILRVQGRKAAFVIAKISNKPSTFKLSARGNETNVQVIAESVGGGGHFSASAAVSKEPLSVFEDNIIQSIVSEKEVK